MSNTHLFNKENDTEKVALEIVSYLKKWGLWQDVQIFTGGRCYFDGKKGELLIREESHPDKYLKGYHGQDCNGEAIWKAYSNPERMLDMTFDGPFRQLLMQDEYEVNMKNVSEEVRRSILPVMKEDEIDALVDEYLDGKIGWDPMEYDSYEEWLALHEMDDVEDVNINIQDIKMNPAEISSQEEYEDYLEKCATTQFLKACVYFEDRVCDSQQCMDETFFDAGEIADMVRNEFDTLLGKYGLMYELGFSWSLTAYRR